FISTLSLHDALPIWRIHVSAGMLVDAQLKKIEPVLVPAELLLLPELLAAEKTRKFLVQFVGEIGDGLMALRHRRWRGAKNAGCGDRKSTRLNSSHVS